MIRSLAMAALLLSACGRSTGGPLEPLEAPGVQLSKDAEGDRAATVRAGAWNVHTQHAITGGGGFD
jgi:hypothetical protein